MRKKIFFYSFFPIIAAAFFTTIIYGTPSLVQKTYKIQNHGLLKLTIPSSWKDQFKQVAKTIPPTIRLIPPSNEKAIALITIIWNRDKVKDFNSPENIKNLVVNTGQHLLKQSVEKKLTLQEIKGKTSAGYYYILTDKAPKPDEYKYLSQGGIGTGDLLLVFSILYNDKNSEFPKTSLQILRKAEHQK